MWLQERHPAGGAPKKVRLKGVAGSGGRSGTMGSVLFLILSILIGGLVMGASASFVHAGPTPSASWTVTSGVGGAIVGGIIARLLFFNPGAHSS